MRAAGTAVDLPSTPSTPQKIVAPRSLSFPADANRWEPPESGPPPTPPLVRHRPQSLCGNAIAEKAVSIETPSTRVTDATVTPPTRHSIVTNTTPSTGSHSEV